MELILWIPVIVVVLLVWLLCKYLRTGNDIENLRRETRAFYERQENK